MSWSINVSGSKKAVIANIRENLCKQDHLRGMQIIEDIRRIPDPISPTSIWDACSHVRVVGSGHGGSVAGLVIEGYNPVPEPMENGASSEPVEDVVAGRLPEATPVPESQES